MRKNVLLLLTLCVAAQARAQDPGPVKFQVRLSPEAAAQPVSGRLLVMMTSRTDPLDDIRTGFGGMGSGSAVYTCAQEVTNVIPGRAVKVDPDVLAYPAAFSSAPLGTWQVMALLDRDHSFARSGEGPGDIRSEVVRLDSFDPAHAGTVSLTLSRVTPAPRRRQRAGISAVTFQSPALTRFWGRPINMRAAVVLPKDAAPGRKYAAVYHVPGFGGDDGEAWWLGPSLQDKMARKQIPVMAHVFLDPETTLGHTEFADSVNNGPWGEALTAELIPFLEKQYPLEPSPGGRFLTGHSSGGWSTLWLQVNYPDLFNGTWSTAPDPVDFRSFSGVNVSVDPPENAFRTPQQRTRNLVRMGGSDVMSFQDFARYEQVAGDYGGQMASFEAVFSPRGLDGRPMRLFDRQTGNVDPFVARAWRKYDIRRVLEAGGQPLQAKLRGKVHIIVGDEDNFHLNEAVALLKGYLTSVHSDAQVTIVPKRDHMNLLMGGLDDRIYKAMGARAPK